MCVCVCCVGRVQDLRKGPKISFEKEKKNNLWFCCTDMKPLTNEKEREGREKKRGRERSRRRRKVGGGGCGEAGAKGMRICRRRSKAMIV